MKTTVVEQKQELNLEELRCYELSGSLCPLVDVGMYDSLISLSNWEDDAMYNLQEDYGEAAKAFACFGNCDVEGYHKTVQRNAAEIIDEYAMPIFKEYGVAAIKVTGIYSPREYNFTTDELDFEVYLTDDFMEKFKENMQRFRTNPSLQKYIEDHWWSRDGFISFMPQSMSEIESFEDEERCLACYLTFALLTEGYWDNFSEGRTDMELYERLSTNECCTGYTNVYLYCSEEWAKLYNDNARMDELYRDVCHALGRPWKSHKQKNWDLNCPPCNEASELVIWAKDMGYSPQDLRKLCS